MRDSHIHHGIRLSLAMKKFSFFLLSALISIMSFSQDTWKVSHNKVEFLTTVKHDPEKNIVLVKQADLNQPGEFELKYFENKPQKSWNRYLVVYDGAENVLMQKEGGTTLILQNDTLKDLLQKNSLLKIFTWTLPSDPELAARIRVRRLHLCTIELK